MILDKYYVALASRFSLSPSLPFFRVSNYSQFTHNDAHKTDVEELNWRYVFGTDDDDDNDIKASRPAVRASRDRTALSLSSGRKGGASGSDGASSRSTWRIAAAFA